MKFQAFLLLFTLLGAIAEPISEVYVHFPDVDMEYKFHKSPLTWYEAKLACASEHAELAMPRNAAEAAIIKNIFEKYPHSALDGVAHRDSVMLGFHDLFEESEFVTLNGDSIQYFYHTWANGQPDNHYDEDCGSMHRSGKLNDYSCGIPGVFICQKQGHSASKNTLSIERCSGGDPAYKYAPGIEKYYKLHMNPKKWTDARLICILEGGHLAIIRNKEEEKYLKKMFNDPINKVNYVQHKDYALLGFHDLYKEGHFTTIFDENLDDFEYVNWVPGQPDNYNGEHCGSMHHTGGLNDFSCKTPAVFICEQEDLHAFDTRFSKDN